MELDYSEDPRRLFGQQYTPQCTRPILSQKLQYSEDTRQGSSRGGKFTYCSCSYHCSSYEEACPYLIRLSGFCLLSKVDEIETVYYTPKDDLLLLVGRLLTEAGIQALAKRFEEDS